MDNPSFSRVLGERIPNGPIFAQAVFPLSLVGEVFGPPEAANGCLAWNFADGRGRLSCSIYCDETQPAVAAELRFVSPIGDESFFEWATERLNLTHNGELPPAFMLRRRMALRVECL